VAAIAEILGQPGVLAALVALVGALTALVRAESARIDAQAALSRLGGRRISNPVGNPPGGVERRSTP